MISVKLILLLVFPIAFLLGKIVAKSSEDEIDDVKQVILFINKILIIISLFILLNYFFSLFTALVVCLMVLVYLITNEQSAKEKVMIAIFSSISTVYLIESVILLGVLASFLKGQTTFKKNEKILSEHTFIQIFLFMFMISFKFILLGVLAFF